MNNEIKFVEFPKMARLSRECIITEKIDGTNASITITEDGQFLTGSRTRWITPQDDNFGFSAWAHEHKDELMKLGVGTHFGEWWGGKIQRGYGIIDKRFSLFNVTGWCEHNKEPAIIKSNNPKAEIKYQQILPSCVSLVPLLMRCSFDDMNSILKCLEELSNKGSVASPGFMKPEGIVVYHIAGGVGFKKTIEKDSEPKSLQV